MALAEPQAPAAATAAAAADPPAAAAIEPPPEPSCRVCYDGADSDIGGTLLAPCQCHGTLRFIHQRCLQEWLQHAPPATRLLCSVCHTAFVFPPGFEVPPTDYDQRHVLQRVGQDLQEALAEAERQEGRWRARQPWPLGLILLLGGAAAASVAAALLSAHLAQRYHEQQVEQWWRRMRDKWRRQAEEEQQQEAAAQQRYLKWLRESRIPTLEEELAQLKRWFKALRTHQRLDRWLPPPLFSGQQRREEQRNADLEATKLRLKLAGKELQLAFCKLEIALGSDSDGEDANGSGSRDAGASSGEGAPAGREGTPDSSCGKPGMSPSRQAARRRERHNLAEPLLRALHGLLRGERRQ